MTLTHSHLGNCIAEVNIEPINELIVTQATPADWANVVY